MIGSAFEVAWDDLRRLGGGGRSAEAVYFSTTEWYLLCAVSWVLFSQVCLCTLSLPACGVRVDAVPGHLNSLALVHRPGFLRTVQGLWLGYFPFEAVGARTSVDRESELVSGYLLLAFGILAV